MKSGRRPLPSTVSRPVLAALASLVPAAAHAHGAAVGMAGFSGGLIHPLITPAHLLLLLGLGLWLGQQRPLDLRLPVLMFLPFSAVGLFATALHTMPPIWQAVLLCLALVMAFLVAASLRLPSWAALPIIATAGLAIGLDSGVDSAASTTALAITLFATWISLGICLVNFAYYTSLLPQRKWVQIGLRVAGSWLTAICLLVLAFALKGGMTG